MLCEVTLHGCTPLLDPTQLCGSHGDASYTYTTRPNNVTIKAIMKYTNT
jgi:hypothetical protein